MQEQKEFSTTLFGFEKKAVLEYIYEQDKEARAALTELAERNTALEESEKSLSQQLSLLTEQFSILQDSAQTDHLKVQEQASDCDRLRERLSKLSSQYHEKENSLQLQMEINKKMQTKISEQEKQIESLQRELKDAAGRFRLCEDKQQDFATLRVKLDEFREEFLSRLNSFEKEFSILEKSAQPDTQTEYPVESDIIAAPSVKVTPRVRGEESRRSFAASGTSISDEKAAVSRNRFRSILNEWK